MGVGVVWMRQRPSDCLPVAMPCAQCSGRGKEKGGEGEGGGEGRGEDSQDDGEREINFRLIDVRSKRIINMSIDM
eukprot:757383-Hanusia_phi.AAC.5